MSILVKVRKNLPQKILYLANPERNPLHINSIDQERGGDDQERGGDERLASSVLISVD